MYSTDLRDALEHKRMLSEQEAWQRATAAQRAQWWPHGAPTGAKARLPSSAAMSGAGPTTAELLEALTSLAEQERAAEATWLGRLVDAEAASLFAWQLQQPTPDPTARPPLSEAERRHRAAADAELMRSWRS
jgi:hypothetical protein